MDKEEDVHPIEEMLERLTISLERGQEEDAQERVLGSHSRARGGAMRRNQLRWSWIPAYHRWCLHRSDAFTSASSSASAIVHAGRKRTSDSSDDATPQAKRQCTKGGGLDRLTKEETLELIEVRNTLKRVGCWDRITPGVDPRVLEPDPHGESEQVNPQEAPVVESVEVKDEEPRDQDESVEVQHHGVTAVESVQDEEALQDKEARDEVELRNVEALDESAVVVSRSALVQQGEPRNREVPTGLASGRSQPHSHVDVAREGENAATITYFCPCGVTYYLFTRNGNYFMGEPRNWQVPTGLESGRSRPNLLVEAAREGEIAATITFLCPCGVRYTTITRDRNCFIQIF